jgi:hypothetical protein
MQSLHCRLGESTRSHSWFPQPQTGENKQRKLSEIPTRRGSLGSAMFILSAVAATLAVPSASYAITVPTAVISVQAAGGTTIFTAGTVIGSGGTVVLGQSSSANASYAGGTGTVSGQGSTIGTFPGPTPPRSNGRAQVEFFFEVMGSAAGVTTVPINFIATVQTSASGPGADAAATLTDPGDQIIAGCSFSPSNASPPTNCAVQLPNHTGETTFAATPGVFYPVQLSAGGESIFGTGSWLAVVDLQVAIDPNFAAASNFTLVFSPDVVPEPGTGLLVMGRTGPRGEPPQSGHQRVAVLLAWHRRPRRPTPPCARRLARIAPGVPAGHLRNRRLTCPTPSSVDPCPFREPRPGRNH